MKKLLKSTIFQWLICFLVYCYCLLIALTCRIKFQQPENLLAAKNSTSPAIIACWHGRLFFTSILMKRTYRKNLTGIISRHGDGELIAKMSRLFGFRTIRGSTNRSSKDKKGAKDRGGQSALRAALQVLKNRQTIIYTPDGPRGPRMQVNDTALFNIAARTQTPIIPLTASASRSWVINSWDRFIIPKPFCSIIIKVDEAIAAPVNNDEKNLENTRKTLEDRLNIISHKIDDEIGVVPIIAAPRT